MALLTSFSLPFLPDQVITLPGRQKKNRISVLLGINGTQKSSILRGLLEDALFPESDPKKNKSAKMRTLGCNANWDMAVPDRVVAISSAATDRFPSKASFGEGRILTKYDIPKYAYVGPRTGRNLVSRVQSVQSLLSEFLQIVDMSSSVSKFITSLSVKTSVPSVMTLRLMRRPRGWGNERSERASSFETFLADSSPNPRGMRSPRLTKFIEEAKTNGSLMEESMRFFDLLNAKELSGGIETELDLSSPRFLGEHQLDPRAIHFGLMVGFAGLEDIKSLERGRHPITPDAFSAGQWGLFSSLTTATLAVRNRTLLLIDEPENALHPAWQREYLAELQQALSHCKECHVVIATHSPLIVSSLGAKDADLIGLRLAEDHSVVAAPLEIPMGWQVTDVLEDIFNLPSTRSPKIVSEIETAMRLIAQGVEQNVSSLQKIAKRLIPLLHSLPEDDVARHVISSICRVSGVPL